MDAQNNGNIEPAHSYSEILNQVQLQNNSHQTKLVVPVVTVFVSPAVAVVVAVMMAVAATLMLLRLRGGAAVVVGGGRRRHDHVDRAERRITSIL